MTTFTFDTTTEEVGNQLKDQIKGKNGKYLFQISSDSNTLYTVLTSS
jgi:hypothetical protein